jgi:hypothetical protein
MATITCPAGHSFSDGQIPSPYEWVLISDENIGRTTDKIIELTRAGADDVEAWAEVVIRSYGYPAYICPECGRLLVFEDGIDKPAASYRRE